MSPANFYCELTRCNLDRFGAALIYSSRLLLLEGDFTRLTFTSGFLTGLESVLGHAGGDLSESEAILQHGLHIPVSSCTWRSRGHSSASGSGLQIDHSNCTNKEHTWKELGMGGEIFSW